MTDLSGSAYKGIFIAVVGPSGAGKDSIMRKAATAFTGDFTVHFARRIVTRASSPDEDHDSVSEGEFSALIEAGALALHWKANGLSYGIPASIHNRLAAGHVVIANASRAIAQEIKTIFPRSVIVHITASENILQQRLTARGREASADLKLRIARSNALEHEFGADIRIENNGELDDAAAQFVKAVRALKPVLSRSDA
jgi:ribose 1,5-bisphosphokinase